MHSPLSFEVNTGDDIDTQLMKLGGFRYRDEKQMTGQENERGIDE